MPDRIIPTPVPPMKERAPHICPACGEGFSCVSAFDAHHSYDGEDTACADPDECGLVWNVERREVPAWTWPPSDWHDNPTKPQRSRSRGRNGDGEGQDTADDPSAVSGEPAPSKVPA